MVNLKKALDEDDQDQVNLNHLVKISEEYCSNLKFKPSKGFKE